MLGLGTGRGDRRLLARGLGHRERHPFRPADENGD